MKRSLSVCLILLLIAALSVTAWAGNETVITFPAKTDIKRLKGTQSKHIIKLSLP